MRLTMKLSREGSVPSRTGKAPSKWLTLLTAATILCLPSFAQISPRTPAQSKSGGKSISGDEHILLCHTDWLRFYRVEVTERSQQGQEGKVWSRWFLIDDKRQEDKAEIDDQLRFYRENHIKIEYAAIEGKLP